MRGILLAILLLALLIIITACQADSPQTFVGSVTHVTFSGRIARIGVDAILEGTSTGKRYSLSIPVEVPPGGVPLTGTVRASCYLGWFDIVWQDTCKILPNVPPKK